MTTEKVSMMHRLEFWGYKFVEWLILKIPDTMIPAVAKSFAVIIYKLFAVRKQVTLENLKIAFPDKPKEWHQKTGYQSYVHFAQMILEFMKLKQWSNGQIREKISEFLPWEAEEHIQKDKPIIFVSGHFGNWEIGMAFLYTLGVRAAIIQQRQKNRQVNERMKVLREKWGMKIIYPRGAVDACLNAISAGRSVALLGDQDAGKRGVFVPFFDRDSSTHIGAAVIHQKSGAPIYFASSVKLNDGKYRIELVPVITELKDVITVEEITRLHTELLEKEIRKYPEQYFWMHRRWKSSK